MKELVTLELIVGVLMFRFLYLSLKHWDNEHIRPFHIWGFIISLITMIGAGIAFLK